MYYKIYLGCNYLVEKNVIYLNFEYWIFYCLKIIFFLKGNYIVYKKNDCYYLVFLMVEVMLYNIIIWLIIWNEL